MTEHRKGLSRHHLLSGEVLAKHHTMRKISQDTPYQILADPGADAMQAFMRVGEEVQPLRAAGKFEQCLEVIVAESQKHSVDSAPLWNRAYNEHYRHGVAG